MHEEITAFYEANHDKLVKKFTKSAGTVWDAEDCVQSAFESALRASSGGIEIANLEHWMNSVVRNMVANVHRERKGVSFESVDEFDWIATAMLDTSQIAATVKKQIRKEPDDNQPLLELHFLKGYSAKDIYDNNRFTYPNTRKIIQRFRDKLKIVLSR